MCSTEKTCSSWLNKTTCRCTPPAWWSSPCVSLWVVGLWDPASCAAAAPLPWVGPIHWHIHSYTHHHCHHHHQYHLATSFRFLAGPWSWSHTWMWTCEDPPKVLPTGAPPRSFPPGEAGDNESCCFWGWGLEYNGSLVCFVRSTRDACKCVCVTEIARYSQKQGGRYHEEMCGQWTRYNYKWREN